MTAPLTPLDHIEHVSTWDRDRVVHHIEKDHGGIADEDAPWQHHRKIHWRDTDKKATVEESADG